MNLTASIYKTDEELQIVWGVVLEPYTKDSQGDIISADTIRKTAHDYMSKSRVVGHQHKERADAVPVESWIAHDDLTMNGNPVKKGSWIMGVHVRNGDMWQRVKNGELTGFSIGGFGTRR